MTHDTQTWDFFLIYSRSDAAVAHEIYESLRSDFRVFLDSESIPIGEPWDAALAAAMSNVKVFLVLLSPDFDDSLLAREEYQIAINAKRKNPEACGLVPISLQPRAILPYGLGIFQGLDLSKHGGTEGIANRLRKQFKAEHHVARPKPDNSHPLAVFPRSGRVPSELITERLITAFASLHDPLVGPALGLMFVDKANAFRRSADPNDESATVVEAYTLPPPGSVSPLLFWRSLLSEARLHSPRMLAAVLLTANTNSFSESALADYRKLLTALVGASR